LLFFFSFYFLFYFSYYTYIFGIGSTEPGLKKSGMLDAQQLRHYWREG
jgi:hypothetical protein